MYGHALFVQKDYNNKNMNFYYKDACKKKENGLKWYHDNFVVRCLGSTQNIIVYHSHKCELFKEAYHYGFNNQ